jgi:hypothetical protein
VIKEANEAVRTPRSEPKSKRRGSYAKFTPSLPLRKTPSSTDLRNSKLLLQEWMAVAAE